MTALYQTPAPLLIQFTLNYASLRLKIRLMAGFVVFPYDIDVVVFPISSFSKPKLPPKAISSCCQKYRLKPDLTFGILLAGHFVPLCASKVWAICAMCNASNGSDVLARAVLEAGAVNRRDARGELVGHQGSVSNCVRTFKSSILQRVPPLQCSRPPFSTHHRPTL